MAYRKAHGNAARRGAGVVIETLPPDRLPRADEAAPSIVRSQGKVTDTASARALASMPRRGRFAPRNVPVDASFEVHNRRRIEWLKQRRDELHRRTGGVSCEVGALLTEAAWMRAFAEWMFERAALAADSDLARQASQLAAVAKGHGAMAWELAKREGDHRKKDKLDPLANFYAKDGDE